MYEEEYEEPYDDLEYEETDGYEESDDYEEPSEEIETEGCEDE